MSVPTTKPIIRRRRIAPTDRFRSIAPLRFGFMAIIAPLALVGPWAAGRVSPASAIANQAGGGTSPLTAVMMTTRGEVKIALYADRAPVNIASFVNLALRGFYDGLTFDRVVAKTAVEGGCPLGKGIGWPGYKTEDEFHPTLRHNGPGFLSFLNAGPNTNGCRFTIILRPMPTMDDHNTILGRVTDGLDVVRHTLEGDRIVSVRIVGDAGGLLSRYKSRVDEWNAALDARFPKLRPAPELTPPPEAAQPSSAPDKTAP